VPGASRTKAGGRVLSLDCSRIEAKHAGRGDFRPGRAYSNERSSVAVIHGCAYPRPDPTLAGSDTGSGVNGTAAGSEVLLAQQSATEFTYGSSTDFGTGQSGLYSDKTNVTFDDFTAYDARSGTRWCPGAWGRWTPRSTRGRCGSRPTAAAGHSAQSPTPGEAKGRENGTGSFVCVFAAAPQLAVGGAYGRFWLRVRPKTVGCEPPRGLKPAARWLSGRTLIGPVPFFRC